MGKLFVALDIIPELVQQFARKQQQVITPTLHQLQLAKLFVAVVIIPVLVLQLAHKHPLDIMQIWVQQQQG